VLELVPGESLEERLKRGPLPLDEALDVCKQIAEGLEAAHEAGVIHRDLKPANIRLTPDGKVKVLDFGLAKPASAGNEGSSTDSVLSTEAGRLLGTPTYMAPEQARGKSIDRRVDVWAFGCVLYECLTARRAFVGETLTDVLGAVLHTQADLSALPASTPRRVRELVEGCFVKDPRRRLRDIGHARLELERALLEPEGATESVAGRGPVASPARSASRLLPWALCALCAGAAAFFALRAPARDAAPSATTGRRLALPRARDGARFPLLSPDGRHLVSEAEDGLWLRALDERDARLLAGTQTGSNPFWAPDGRQIGFFADGKLKRVALGGAPPEVVADVPVGQPSATWSIDGTILVDITESTDEEGWYVVAPGTGRAVKIRGFARDRAVDPDKTFPCFLPDGRHFLFTESHENKPYLQVGSLDSDERRRLTGVASMAQYAAPGYVLYVRDGVLLAQGFDAQALELRGEPRELARDVYFHGPTGTAGFSASQQGTIVLRRVSATSSLRWFDRGGRELETVLSGQNFGGFDLAPDGRRVAYSVIDARDGTTDLWLLDLARKLPTRLTSAARSEFNPCWDPTGRFLAYSADWKGPPNLHLLELAPGTSRELTPFDRLVQNAGSWTPDGSALAYSGNGPRGIDMWTVEIASGERRALLATEFNEADPRISPDGKRVAFAADNSGRTEVYLMSFPGGGELVRLSVDGGYDPQWSAEGSEVFFRYDDALLCVSLAPDGAGHVQPEPPRVLFRLAKNALGNWCVTKDGQRFLVELGDPEDARPIDDVLVDWPLLLAD
jgi:WD40 repeat protein